ncbi:MAG TPA: radical SAM protein [Polyangia bacterium]|nr:radical SAM protein [Polyangia bacterium]
MDPAPDITNCELGPIRPPSEATSLLIRVTRNCPWNGCAFCSVYKRTRFSRRETAELLAEIELLARAATRVRALSGGGPDGEVDSRKALAMIQAPDASDEERRVALWLARGGRHVFLQDADSLAIRPERLLPVLEALRGRFPTIDRVTTYARSRTLCARTLEQLHDLRAAGLTRIHVGVESGSDRVLELVNKGCRAEHHVEGCRRAIAAGFEVCCYVMPGLGGRALSAEHAAETGLVLAAIDPQHVRLRTLWIDPGSPLALLRDDGSFEYPEEEELVVEIRTLLGALRGCRGRVISDHERNLLVDLEGRLDTDADLLAGLCTRFLELDPVLRDAFVVARRAGYVRTLDTFLASGELASRFVPVAADIRNRGAGSLIRGMELEFGIRRL